MCKPVNQDEDEDHTFLNTYWVYFKAVKHVKI